MNSYVSKNVLPIKIIRGGSSKGVFVWKDHLPPPGPELDHLVLRLFGTPDIRQIDGLGGGDKLTSKMAIMALSTRPDCDIAYLFAQVGTEFPDVDWCSNCGNISTGAALFAANEYLGHISGNLRHISIEQVNTGRRLLATVPLSGEEPENKGDFIIGGVPGNGPRIDLDFVDFVGSCLNRGLFPTGVRQQYITLPNNTHISVSIIDMANLNILVRAEDMGVDITKYSELIMVDKKLQGRLDQIRKAVLLLTGMASMGTVEQRIRTSVNPLIHLLSSPRSYRDLNNTNIKKVAHDILALSYSRGAFSKAYPATGAIGVAVASRIKGTIANEFTCQSTYPEELRIGHPSGCLSVAIRVSDIGDILVTKASIGRTARLLLEGTAYLD